MRMLRIGGDAADRSLGGESGISQRARTNSSFGATSGRHASLPERQSPEIAWFVALRHSARARSRSAASRGIRSIP